MERSIVSEGKTSTEAIEKGLKELNISKDEAEIKIIEEKKKSFFSILDPHVVKVEITVKEGVDLENRKKKEEPQIKEEKHREEKEPVSEKALETAKQTLDEFLSKFLKMISDKIEYSVSVEEECVFVSINGEGSSKLIGYRGEALNATQLILTGIIKNKCDEAVRVVLDVEEYRGKREKTLEELAKKLEKTVLKNGKSITLEPMNPYERKIIHTALQNSVSVKTYSIGEGEHRRVVVSKK